MPHALLIAVALSAAGPYADHVERNATLLQEGSPSNRAAAAERLGFLRAYSAEVDLLGALHEDAKDVRRQAAMALAWCGSRKSVSPLIETLADDDWFTAQAAHGALVNLTGMEFPFDAAADDREKTAAIERWRTWWKGVSADAVPPEVLDLLKGPKPWNGRPRLIPSTTYRGPVEVLLDGRIGPRYWQTKNVPFPQSLTIDLGRKEPVESLVVHQYGKEYVMTDYEVAIGDDGKTFESIRREKGNSPVWLEVPLGGKKTRFIRITSYNSAKPVYPTTFFEIEVNGPNRPAAVLDVATRYRYERGLRAIGSLGGEGAAEKVLEFLGSSPPRNDASRPMVQMGTRALGRLGGEAAYAQLVKWLDDTYLARYAAEALGDLGDPRAVRPLLAAYPKFAKDLKAANPKRVPADDVMGFPSQDRMLENPYAIASALARLPLDDEETVAALRELAPRLIANLPGDHDTFFLYEPEVGHELTRYLLEKAGLRHEACERAMMALGQPRRVAAPDVELQWPALEPKRMASWLPAVCTQEADVPRLVALLRYEDGWVSLNAAKTLAWIGDSSAIEPLLAYLHELKPEADYGYNGTFKMDEYDSPAPRRREALVRALGLLKAEEATDDFVAILRDQRSAMEIRYAAAEALRDLGTDRAAAVLREAAVKHDYHTIRHVAQDALRAMGKTWDAPNEGSHSSHPQEIASADEPEGPAMPEAIVFIKGDNNIPNTIGTVEQADRWRQTYVVTDSGPVYRPGRNLYVFSPPRPDGEVRPLTTFADGYVGEPEVSWDGTQIVFTRRGETDPWWHVWKIGVDGSGLTQLTDGPYHAVSPAWMADGRIVFASSRAGLRDEYHGYPCTTLHVMNADGSNPTPLAMNIGRDNEPSVGLDGRLYFSRLEVFYSRNKTELTLHATHPDGTKDVVLYGPERRVFWRDLNHGPRTPADGQEAPLTHRVLRMTQPQMMPDGRNIVVVTQGGLIFVGKSRLEERFVSPDNKKRAYTTPFPLPDGRLLCASTLKTPNREEVDLGLFLLDPETQKLEPIYNDPATADFEPRPIMPRPAPPQRPVTADNHAYSGTFFCSSVFSTQEPQVRPKGRFVRLIEAQPVIGRHSTHTNPMEVWQNHGGTHTRILGTAPLAPDGSFYAEAPADRLLHFQVLDSDRRVVGNQRTWISVRPGEQKSCVGCHEHPNTTTTDLDPAAIHRKPVDFLPDGKEFSYRAKAWFKGSLPDVIEERTRTVRAVNLPAK